MKQFTSLLLVALLALVAIPAFAGEEKCAPKDETNGLPPGHYRLIAKAADNFLSTAPGGNRSIYAETLMDGIDDPTLNDELGDFFLLDIRLPADFAKDTVPGAINIPMADLAKTDNLAKLPTDKPILVICHTGHTASISNAVLGVLGYDAWTLRFGMMGWRTMTKTKVWSPKYSQDIYGAGYPVQKAPL
ncbi:MAG: hypothetical protein A2091_07440 [Desulfuromonadales bacterium GWD2_61_12]|nr:MAG: hypothetical protein A2005_08000 [Desulfuromonadales bacterium GWC2_61_20]OGR36736.1 MAG: hypothetical protein A2091_07440 [Desulfuromonadales bacterium GWD2_61_12]HAD03502.1 hypothetical protein [Desulfuromonas sp.]HBT83774.1 hypothetical protein [Desulfuromonas sp.]